MAQARHFFECRVFAYKGTREALLRNSCHIYNPSKPPFKYTSFLFVAAAWQNKQVCSALTLIATLRREACGKCPTCSPTVNTYYQHSALALLTAVRVRLCYPLDVVGYSNDKFGGGY